MEDRKFNVGKEVAEQIWREQQLTSYRMTWNLSFQGFIIAAVAVTFVQNMNAWLALSLRLSIGVAGLVVAIVTRSSVQASQEQREYLKQLWYGLYHLPQVLHAYPRPFAEYNHSRLGRRAPDKILLVLIALWVILLVVAIVSFFFTALWNGWIFSYQPAAK